MAKRKPNNNTQIKLPGVIIVMLNAESDKKSKVERQPLLAKAIAG